MKHLILLSTAFVACTHCMNAQPRTAVVFTNGVLTTRDQARSAANRLQLKLREWFREHGQESTFNNTWDPVTVAYNPTSGFLMEFYESYQQWCQQPSPWVDFVELITMAFVDVPACADTWAAEIFPSITDQVFLDQPTLSTQLDMYRTTLNAGKRIISVAHSQGNFYANKIYDQLAQERYIGPTNLKIVGVATPADHVAGGGPYVTVEGDVITSVPGHLKANTANSPPCTYPSIACHAFSDGTTNYLDGNVTGPLILSYIGDLNSTALLVFLEGGDVWLMNTDGNGQMKLTNSGDVTGPPRLASGTVVFARAGQLYRTDTTGSVPVPILNTTGVLEYDLKPSGDKLVLTYVADYNFNLFTMNIDGTGLQAINTTSNLHQTVMSYGGDGYIYFDQSVFGNAYSQEVYRISENGVNNPTLLVNYFSQYPAPGGPGNKVAFLYNQPAPMLKIMNSDGSGQVNVPNSPAGICGRIAYDQYQNVIYYQLTDGIWSINADTGATTLLTTGATTCAGVDYGTAP